MAHKGRTYPYAPGRDLWIIPYPNKHFGLKNYITNFIALGQLKSEYDQGIQQLGDVEYDRVNGTLKWWFEPVKTPHATKFYVKWGGSSQLIRDMIFTGQIYIGSTASPVASKQGIAGQNGVRLVGLRMGIISGGTTRIDLEVGGMAPLLWSQL
jgi:hypothetical protein